MPYSLRQAGVGSLTSPADYISLKMQETGTTIYRPYPRILEHLTICRCHCKGSMLSAVFFKTLSVGPVWGSYSRPPAKQSGALQNELTGRRLYRGLKKGQCTDRPPIKVAVVEKRPLVEDSFFSAPESAVVITS